MTEPKPCPFCAGTNTEKVNELMIGCHDCHIVVKLWSWGFGHERDVENVWNKREGERRARDEGFREAMERYST